MRAYMESLIGHVLPTVVSGKPNTIIGVEGSSVLVATEDNPGGARVSVSLVQSYVDRVFAGEEVIFDPHRRSAFVGAVLQTMDRVEVLTEPRRARLVHESPQARADRLVITTLDALGGAASRREIIDWAMEHGGFDAARLAATDAGRPLADQDMTWALSRAVEAGSVVRPERAQYRLTPTRSNSRTNPDWEFDELILALDLYLRWRPRQPPSGHPDLQTLSDLLTRLPIHPEDTRADSFRNANSVRRKLGDYTDPDPAYTGKPTKGGEGVHLVWAQFADDPDALAAAVEAITAAAEGDAPPLPPEEGEAIAVEGRILYREHRYRERNAAVVKAKKDATMKLHGRLACEVCTLDFAARYGAIGSGFIEAHHTVPLALGSERTTTADDLALVCPNCHRMLHKAQPTLSIEQLREQLQT